jgi:hypothetical protein
VGFRRDPAILDLNVREAVNVLARQYECEWRMGRPSGLVPAQDDPPVRDITTAEMAACLKRIRKSIDRWSKEGGPRGYLNFVRQYIV